MALKMAGLNRYTPAFARSVGGFADFSTILFTDGAVRLDHAIGLRLRHRLHGDDGVLAPAMIFLMWFAAHQHVAVQRDKRPLAMAGSHAEGMAGAHLLGLRDIG